MNRILFFIFIQVFAIQMIAQQNTILIIADDVSPDYFGVLSKTTDTATTPNIRALAETGIRYTKAWAAPVCSPTRAGMLTGQYSFRTGVGGVISGTAAPQLDTAEMTIARLLKSYAPTKYATACVGKWHVHNNAPAKRSYPNLMGFDFYSGSFNGAITDYYNYPIIRNGATDTVKIYATTQTINDAIAWLDTVQSTKPFFLWVAFNAPHTPYHLPPSSLCNTAGLTGTQAHIDANPKLYFKAAIEAMDSEIGRLIQYLKTKNKFTNTNFIFIGDNGSSREMAQNADNTKSKETIYDYGVRVPFVVSGPRVTNKNIESDALINTVDIFATVAEMSEFTSWKTSIPSSKTIDSRSFLPIVNGEKVLIRNWIFSEQFNTPSEAKDGKTIRNQDYHLLRLDNGTEEFYNQTLDKEEANNLLKTTMSSTDWTNYKQLCDTLTTLTGKGSCQTASVSNTNNLNIKLYPNPTSNYIRISSDIEIIEVCIHNLIGNKLIVTSSNEIDISRLDSGIYFVEVTQKNNTKSIHKIIKI
jgi:arylsulfatase B